jgi:hypothetical protein
MFIAGVMVGNVPVVTGIVPNVAPVPQELCPVTVVHPPLPENVVPLSADSTFKATLPEGVQHPRTLPVPVPAVMVSVRFDVNEYATGPPGESTWNTQGYVDEQTTSISVLDTC